MLDRIGVRNDVPLLDVVSVQLGEAIAQTEVELADVLGHVINPASHQQVAKALFEELDLPILARTDSGAPSTREETLIQLKDMSPAVPLV